MKSITRDWVRSALKALATPIDFDDLIRRGILKKAGARTYWVLKPQELPKDAAQQAVSITQTQTGTKVRFGNFSKRATRALKELER